MEFVFDDSGACVEYELTVTDPAARVSDLAEALRLPPVALVIDGRLVAGTVGLRASGLVTGSTVASAASLTHTRPEAPAWEARVVGGLDAGARVGLPVGNTLIGRDVADSGGIGIDHGAVSRRHGLLTVTEAGTMTVTDLDSRNGIDVNGTLITEPTPVGSHDSVGIAGAALLRIAAKPDASQRAPVDMVHGVRHGWRVPFHRQARHTLPPATPLPEPVAPQHGGRSPFLYASLIGPVILAAITVWMFHDWRFAAFAIVSPIGIILASLEDRLRGRGSRRRGQRAYLDELVRFESELGTRHQLELQRRRTSAVDPAEAAFRAETPGARLWERRAGSPDFLTLGVATGDQPWQPELLSADPMRPQERSPEVAALLAARAELPRVPVSVNLRVARVLGIEGNGEAVVAAARAVVCEAAVTTGPADLAIAVFTHPARATAWDWTKWLPHILDRTEGTVRLIAVGRAETDLLATDLLAAHPFPTAEQGALLVVVDGAALLEGRNCPLRELISATGVVTRAVVVADPLPALCETVLTVRASGSGELRQVNTGECRGSLLVTGIGEARARTMARALARFEDPEIALAGAGLPAEAPLLPLLDLPGPRTEELAARWSTSAKTLRAGTVLGVTESGRYEIDLDDDGPHALIAGTTGSGKSELLRSFVTGLAMGNDPDHLVFVLIDYKGGGALDDCARLPHVVGLVTDLDDQLSMRALRCLEAELRRRERQLRTVKVSDFHAYQRLRDTSRPDLEPMPRMVVVIDEFATLVKALREFVDGLVDIAQRGRSLGVHLVMATQRPAGSVSDAIKANVKLRIALRLETAEDSRDVIDSPAAATIGPRQWGRAFRRVKGGEVEAVQTAFATTVTNTDGARDRLRLRPFALSHQQQPTSTTEAVPDLARTDLRRLVDLACDTFHAGGYAPPRTPWPDPLAPLVALEELPTRGEAGMQTSTAELPAFLLADDPHGQRQLPLGWDPDAGNLLVFGAVGSGTTTTLATVLLSWARVCSPQRLQVFTLDHGAGELAALADLPHSGGYAPTGDRERVIRLVALLTGELERRKTIGGDHPRWLVAVDGLGALLTAGTDDQFLATIGDRLAPVYAEGPSVGIAFVGTADRAGGIPGAWQARTAQKLLLRLADVNDYGIFGIPPREVPAATPGRGLVAATRQVVQVATARDGIATMITALAKAWPDTCSVPGITVLPERVPLAQLDILTAVTAHPWRIPLGLSQESLAPVALSLHEYDHAVIIGPPRSGRSTMLCTVAAGLIGALDTPIFGYAPRSSPLRQAPEAIRLAATVDELRTLLRETQRPPVVLVDDADLFDDFTGVFTALVTHDNPAVHVIAVARNEGSVRSSSHWLGMARRSRCGVLLMPDNLDGDLLGVNLPRRPALAARAGRGYLTADGTFTAIQGAVPDWPKVR